MLTLSALHTYPVKSLRGIAQPEAGVDHRGLVYDRHWMLVDRQGGFLSQRSYPRMGLVQPLLLPGALQLSAPGMTDLRVASDEAGVPLGVQVWGDRCAALAVSGEADDWFSRFLGTTCRLVCLPRDSLRRVDPDYAEPADQVGFADGFPFLLITEASLADLNQRLAEPVSMARFRPNLVVAGAAPYAEDSWRRIRIGGLTFRVAKPCSRCAIITLNPETSQRTAEPLATLAGYRKRGGQVFFGQNLIHNGIGKLQIGDAVEVLE